MTYTIASASGLTFAFYFFLAISSVLAFAIYTLLTRPTARRIEMIGLGTVRKPVAAGLGLLFGSTVFAAIYLSSLAGFHAVTAGVDHIRLDYAVPRRSIALRYSDIGDVIRRPAYRLQWRLEIYTRTGSRFESAAGSYTSVKDATEEVERRRARPQ